jgi:hypothetical protein
MQGKTDQSKTSGTSMQDYLMALPAHLTGITQENYEMALAEFTQGEHNSEAKIAKDAEKGVIVERTQQRSMKLSCTPST